MRELLLLLLIIYSMISISNSLVYAYNLSVTLNKFYYEYYNVTVYSGQSIAFNVTSNVPVTVMVFNLTQFNFFYNMQPSTPIYRSVGINVTGIVGPLIRGTYYVVAFNNVSNSTAFVRMNITEVPVDIHYERSSLPAPVGIVDYGVVNSTGRLIGEILKYNEAIGYITIYNISAYNSTFEIPSGAGLQLNAVLQVNTLTKAYQFWLQNVVDFITINDTYYFTDNIWNFTSEFSNMSNGSVSGNGHVYFYNKELGYFYGVSTNNFTYITPFSLILYIKLLSVNNNGVTVSFGYNNGSGVIWYDNATIKVSNVKSAYMLINGYNMTSRLQYYDLELVFGGIFDGEYTFYKSMNASLGLQIILLNGTNITLSNLYTFGSDTEESADNLMTIYENGYAWVIVGNDNFYTQINPKIPNLIFPKQTHLYQLALKNGVVSFTALIFIVSLIVLAIKKRRK